MYLAALVGESPHTSTYFTAILEGVGGGGPHEKAHVKKRRLKSKGNKTLVVCYGGQPFLIKFLL